MRTSIRDRHADRSRARVPFVHRIRVDDVLPGLETRRIPAERGSRLQRDRLIVYIPVPVHGARDRRNEHERIPACDAHLRVVERYDAVFRIQNEADENGIVVNPLRVQRRVVCGNGELPPAAYGIPDPPAAVFQPVKV